MLRSLLLAAVLSVAAAAQTQAPAPVKPEQQQVKTYTLPPEKLAKAIAYDDAKNRMYFAGIVYSVLVLARILAWRLAPRFRDWARAASRRRFVQAYIFAPLLFLAVDILELPMSAYNHHLQLEYEQSVQGWGSWFWDWTKGELIGFVLGGFLIWVLYGAIRRSPRRWWFWSWAAAVPLVVFLVFITPLVITPMFYNFEPLAAKQPILVAEIGKVVARGGLDIPPSRMFEMKASEKVKSLNAYVTGLGASKRVVVWDTTIQKMTTGETLFVFGHEMGHYVMHHVWLSIGAICLLLLVLLFLGFHVMHRALARWGKRWAIEGLDDWASLPVLLMAFTVFGFLAEPAMNSFSRVLEHNADIYGLEVIHGIVPDSAQAAAASFQILGEVALANPNPNPLIEFWRYSHPPVGKRVQFAAGYDPWSKGEPRKYVQ